MRFNNTCWFTFFKWNFWLVSSVIKILLLFYSSPKGALKDWVAPIEDSTYDILIPNVNYNSSGRYKCDYLTAEIYSMEAELMTLGKHLGTKYQKENNLTGGAPSISN